MLVYTSEKSGVYFGLFRFYCITIVGRAADIVVMGFTDATTSTEKRK